MLNIQDTLKTAIKFHQSGDLKTAEHFYQQVLQQEPGEPNANNLLGMILHQRGQHNAALARIQRAIQGNPGVAEFHKNLGRVQGALGRAAEAAESYRRATAISPGDHEAHVQLGAMLAAHGEREAAIEAYDTAIGLRPTDSPAIAGKAMMLQRLRRYDEAYELLQPLLEKTPPDVRVTTVFGSLCRHVDKVDEGIERLEAALAAPNLPPALRQSALFNLADLLHSRGEFDAAFDAYKRANESVPRQWDPKFFTGMVDRTIKLYDKAFVKSMPRTTISSEAPVFIVGLARSGTSLVEQIIDCNPLAFGAGELPALRQMVVEIYHRLKTSKTIPDFLADAPREMLQEMAETHIRSLMAKAPGAKRITDKSPGNFVNLGLIAQLYPKARVIHCRRDPRDACLSCYCKNFTFGLEFSSRLEHLAHYYLDSVRMMDHWRETLDLPILDVQYEDLVADQEAESRRIIEFLGIPWDDASLEFHASQRDVNTASHEQVRRPMYRSSVGRFRDYEQHLAPLIETLEQGGVELHDPPMAQS